MKKIIIILSVCVLIDVCSIIVFSEESDFYQKSVDSIINEIDDSTVNILRDLNLDDFTYDELYNISFKDISELIISVFKGNLKIPFECSSVLLCVVILFTVAEVYINRNNSIALYTENLSVIFVSLFILSKIISTVSRVVTAIETLGILMKTLVPVLAAIITFSGSPALALSYNATTVYVAQVITAVCRDFLTPILIMFTCVAVCAALNGVIKSESVLNMIRKAVNMILGLSGTVFTGFVTIKDFLASGADKVSVKGVRFLIGSSVPVVGSALSEGLSSVIASVTLMKNTIGVVGIIIIVVLVLPVVSELIMWIFSLSFISCICEIFSHSRLNSVITSFRFVFSTLLSVVLFSTYILIVSTGLTILLGHN